MGKLREWVFRNGSKITFTGPTGDPKDEFVGSDHGFCCQAGPQADLMSSPSRAGARIFHGMDYGYKSDPILFVPIKGESK